MNTLNCFKAYDIRGRVPNELNTDIAWRIGRATSEFLCVKEANKTFIIGGDARLSTPDLKVAVGSGLQVGGAKVIDIGLCGTEEVYFATSYLKAAGGIMVTASHNPKDYNGMKLVREQSKPISKETGLCDIQRLVEEVFVHRLTDQNESYQTVTNIDAYVDDILSSINLDNLHAFKLVVNAGNGVAGHIIDAIEKRFKRFKMGYGTSCVSDGVNQAHSIPVDFVKILHEPNGHFPHGVPNPMLQDARQKTIDAVLAHKADFGIAWDGDFDRCFFFDEKGHFIESYYIVGLLGELFLSRFPGAKIIHDARLIWNTIDQVTRAGGIPIQSKSGHTFIKERMRTEGAIYGGEMSGHHYFRDFSHCDSGMIPWLLVAELMSQTGKKLSELVDERVSRFPVSGEINSIVTDPQAVIDRILSIYQKDALTMDDIDGISLDMGQWRFNLRQSNTEPMIRLNVESRGDAALLKQKTEELLVQIRN